MALGADTEPGQKAEGLGGKINQMAHQSIREVSLLAAAAAAGSATGGDSAIRAPLALLASVRPIEASCPVSQDHQAMTIETGDYIDPYELRRCIASFTRPFTRHTG